MTLKSLWVCRFCGLCSLIYQLLVDQQLYPFRTKACGAENDGGFGWTSAHGALENAYIFPLVQSGCVCGTEARRSLRYGDQMMQWGAGLWTRPRARISSVFQPDRCMAPTQHAVCCDMARWSFPSYCGRTLVRFEVPFMVTRTLVNKDWDRYLARGIRGRNVCENVVLTCRELLRII
jgi:hypothetical protein